MNLWLAKVVRDKGLGGACPAAGTQHPRMPRRTRAEFGPTRTVTRRVTFVTCAFHSASGGRTRTRRVRLAQLGHVRPRRQVETLRDSSSTTPFFH